jgi:hypothetical protein
MRQSRRHHGVPGIVEYQIHQGAGRARNTILKVRHRPYDRSRFRSRGRAKGRSSDSLISEIVLARAAW